MLYGKNSASRCLLISLAVAVFVSAPALSYQTKPAVGKSNKEASTKEKNPSPKNMEGATSLSPREKRQQAMSLLEEVLATAYKITPVEYGILTQVEAATLLWQSDKDRALAILKRSVEAMSALLEEAKDSKTAARPQSEKQRRLRFLVFLKIARLNPDLIREMTPNTSGDKHTETISAEWTDEARALMLVAEEQIDQNPESAARLAEQSLSLGVVDWQGFLFRLNLRDNSQAEQLAVNVMNRLRNSPVKPSHLLNFNSYAMRTDSSAQLQEQFFSSLAARLRRDIRPDANANEIRSSLQTARIAMQMVTSLPHWQSEFADIVQTLESLFTARNLPLPGHPVRVSVDTSMMNPSSVGDTQGVAEIAERMVTVKDSRTRDREYQRLAFTAASNSDARLAEELLSKIDDEETRCSTSMMIYSPLIRKELSERNWTQAQKYAAKITHPLGRTIVLDSIAQAMPKADKLAVKEIYDSAAAQLYREVPTEKVAKAFLFLAKSLFRADPEGSLEATKSAVYVLNKLRTNDDLSAESEARGALSTWLRLPSSIDADEAMDLTEMILPLFKDMAKRDANSAMATAYSFSHAGLYSLAQLGIARGLMEEAGKTRKPAVHRVKRTP